MLVTEQTAYSTAMNSISLLATDGLRQIRQIRKCMQSAWNPSNPWNPSRATDPLARGPTATRTNARAADSELCYEPRAPSQHIDTHASAPILYTPSTRGGGAGRGLQGPAGDKRAAGCCCCDAARRPQQQQQQQQQIGRVPAAAAAVAGAARAAGRPLRVHPAGRRRHPPGQGRHAPPAQVRACVCARGAWFRASSSSSHFFIQNLEVLVAQEVQGGRRSGAGCSARG